MIKQQQKRGPCGSTSRTWCLSTHWNNRLLWGGSKAGKHMGSFPEARDRRGTGLDGGCWGAGCACPVPPAALAWDARCFGSPHRAFRPLPSSTAPLSALLPPWGAQPGSTPSPAPEGPRRWPRRKSRVYRDRWEYAKKAESPYSGKWVAEWKRASSRSTHPGALHYRAGVRVFPLFSFLWPVPTSSAF